MKTNGWMLLSVLVALAPWSAGAVGDASATAHAECAVIEELCEQACLNLEAGTEEASIVACYVECSERAESCRSAAP